MFIFIRVVLIFVFLIFPLLEDKSQASETKYIYLNTMKYSERFFSPPHLCFGDFYELKAARQKPVPEHHAQTILEI